MLYKKYKTFFTQIKFIRKNNKSNLIEKKSFREKLCSEKTRVKNIQSSLKKLIFPYFILEQKSHHFFKNSTQTIGGDFKLLTKQNRGSQPPNKHM